MQSPSCSTLILNLILETWGKKTLILTVETQGKKQNHFLK
jgi:hypothetical protein